MTIPKPKYLVGSELYRTHISSVVSGHSLFVFKVIDLSEYVFPERVKDLVASDDAGV